MTTSRIRPGGLGAGQCPFGGLQKRRQAPRPSAAPSDGDAGGYGDSIARGDEAGRERANGRRREAMAGHQKFVAAVTDQHAIRPGRLGQPCGCPRQFAVAGGVAAGPVDGAKSVDVQKNGAGVPPGTVSALRAPLQELVQPASVHGAGQGVRERVHPKSMRGRRGGGAYGFGPSGGALATEGGRHRPEYPWIFTRWQSRIRFDVECSPAAGS